MAWLAPLWTTRPRSIRASGHPGIRLVAAADPRSAPREAFIRDFGGDACVDARQVCERADVEAVYIATPHQFHREHAIMAAGCGKHILVVKALALTLEDCDAIIEAVERNGVHLIVGHARGVDPEVRRTRQLIHNGEVGDLGLIAKWNYTNFIYRPRRPEELDTMRGGGILFNQILHQIDTIRVLGGDIASLRGYARLLDPSRPTEGLASAMIQLRNGAAATLVYSGYDHFDADELHHWIAEIGAPKQSIQHGAAFRALAIRTQDETRLRVDTFALGARPYVSPPHRPHLGAMTVTCAKADLRASKDGVIIYGASGPREVALDKRPSVAGRNETLDDLIAAARHDQASLHDARFGRETLRAVLALQLSAQERREIAL